MRTTDATRPATPHRRALVLGGAGATLAAALWLGRRRDRDAPRAAEPVDVARRRRALGLLRFTWLPFEAEAPMVAPDAPFGSADALADLALVAGSSDAAALRGLYAAAMNALPAFVAAAAPRLKPARYRLEPADAARMRAAGAALAKSGWAPGLVHDLGVAADGGVDYTPEHSLILQQLRWAPDWSRADSPLGPDEVVVKRDDDTGRTRWPVLAVDPKRPYGDSTNAEYDMARALGLKIGVDAEGTSHLDPDTVARLTALHLTTPAALRVLVVHGMTE